jgi:hypothetical protein
MAARVRRICGDYWSELRRGLGGRTGYSAGLGACPESLPLAIGLKELIQIQKRESIRTPKRNGSLGVLSIAAITLTNGHDDLGVYVPFFLASRARL